MGLIERELQSVLNTVFSEEIKKRRINISPYTITEEGRADIVLKKNDGAILFFIELKDPNAKDGKTVFDYSIIGRESERAKKLKVHYFGICNFVQANFKHLTDNDKEDFLDEGNLFRRVDLDRLRLNFKINDTVLTSLRSVANFYLDKAEALLTNKQIRFKPVDELFIYKLKSLIQANVYEISDSVYKKYISNREFKQKIKNYVQNQQWTIPSSIEEIENLTFISVLVLVSKLIFYKSVFDNKSYDLSKLNIPENIDTAKKLNTYLWENYFEEFKVITNDFELLIGEKSDIANEIAFQNDEIVNIVKGLVLAENAYDFSKIPYDTIGRIFEELIREDERHKMGQYFTPPHVIDFINSFCIKTGNEKILDPSCGSGTFLVRAYERKKSLTKKTHSTLLSEIFGVDLSNYACYLSMLNMASRTFDKPSYPKIANKDFFKAGITGFEKFPDFKMKDVKTSFNDFDVIVGNPPYTKQEDITAFNENEKSYIASLIKKEWNILPSGQSPIYSHFFFHGAYLLKDKGYLGFITSNSMLDADFGIELQKWMLKNFRIVAIIDSKVERFFPTASVNTCITILQKRSDIEKQDVKFIYLKRKLQDIINHYGDTDKLVKHIESTNTPQENAHLNLIIKSSTELLTSSKWGMHLKTPVIYDKIKLKGSDALTQLSPKIANLKRGLTTGCVAYFELKDRTQEKGIEKYIVSIRNNRLKKYTTISQITKAGLRLVENGLSELWLIEEVFIKPFITSTKEIENYSISKSDTVSSLLNVCLVDNYYVESISNKSKKTLDIARYKNDLKKEYPYLWSYIHWGENNTIKDTIVSEIPSVKSNGQAWWDLNEKSVYDIILLRFRDKRNWSPFFTGKLLASDVVFVASYINKKNSSIYNVSLNSSFTILETELYGRVNLGEGLLTTYGPELKQLLVLDNIDKTLIDRFTLINNKLKGVKVKSLYQIYCTESPNEINLKKVDELTLEIDHLFLEALGFKSKSERETILISLYSSILDLVNSRLTKADSQGKSKNKVKRVSFDLLLAELEEILDERKISASNTVKFARVLKPIIKELLPVLKDQEKLFQHFWKNKFKVEFNQKKKDSESQIKLF